MSETENRVSERWQPKYAKYSHDALVAQIMLNPTATNEELGKVFNRTKQWIMLIRNSDMFLEKLALAHKELSDPLVSAGIEERLSMLTNRSIEVLMHKMARPAAEIPDNLAIAAANFGAKAKMLGGFGVKVAPEAPAPAVDRIERLAERLVALNGPKVEKQEIVDVEVKE